MPIDFAQLFELSLDILGVANFQGYFTRVNDQWTQTLGWTREEILALPYVQLIHPDDVAATQAEADKLSHGQKVLHFENRYRHRDGSYRLLEWRALPLVEEGLIYAAARDITDARAALEFRERERVEADLRRANASMEAILLEAGSFRDAAPGILRALATNLGWDAGEYWARDPKGDRLYLEASWTREDAALKEYESASRAVSFERGIGLPGIAWERGELVWFPDLPVNPLFPRAELARAAGLNNGLALPLKANDRSAGVIALFSRTRRELDSRTRALMAGIGLQLSEVAHRKLLEAQFLQSQKMEAVGRLAGGIAHDFNNLLTAILGFSELALEALPKGSVAAGYVNEVKSAGERSASLTRQLLAFSRRQVIQPRVLVINELVRGMDGLLRRLVGADIEIRTVLHPGLASASVDPGQVEQVVMNLAVNARDAMPGGGTLTIETANVSLDEPYTLEHPDARPGEYVLLSVSDTGCGMDKGTLARIFEPFFTTKDPGKGTGLGLSTVYGISRQAGGHVGVYSEPAHGTTFRVYFPRSNAASPAPRESIPAHNLRGGNETILVVDDNIAIIQLSVHVLESKGYRVITAKSGEEALAVSAAHKGKIDLLVTDVVMPGIDGSKLAATLAGKEPGIRVLYVSGYTTESVVHHGVVEAGVNFLQKPFTPNALLKQVREILDKG